MVLSVRRAEGGASTSVPEMFAFPLTFGNAACNLGEHSRRHHATNRAWRDALAAVATGTVILGDKQEADKYRQYNEGHVADIIQVGASPWGTRTGLGRQKSPRA